MKRESNCRQIKNPSNAKGKRKKRSVKEGHILNCERGRRKERKKTSWTARGTSAKNLSSIPPPGKESFLIGKEKREMGMNAPAEKHEEGPSRSASRRGARRSMGGT